MVPPSRRQPRPGPALSASRHCDEYLADLDARFDAGSRLPWSPASGPGYHTRIPNGVRVHQTREAADYALALLRVGRTERAHEVLMALVELQVTDPLAEHYGIWGWYVEEPPEQMAPADWNWADFIGVRLAQVLAVHHDLLEPALLARVRSAVEHAALSIFRRNVDCGYTNIAVMGGVVSAAAGELLDEPRLLDYGRRRLAAVLALREELGGFTEYNSPTYHRVILEELERAALILTDPGCREIAERLREHTWAALADQFHPGTGQLAGPISRAYHDWLDPELAGYLAARTGAEIVAHDGDAAAPPDLVPALPCPEPIAQRFKSLPQAPVMVRRRYNEQTSGTTWLVNDACLGSASEEHAWTQRRPLLGYWRTDVDPAVALRARMLLDGHDLSAAWCRQAQDGPRVLSAWWLSYDSGDFHPNLDKPVDSLFALADLRLVVSLRGAGVGAADLGDGMFALTAGPWQAIVRTLPAAFRGRQVGWQALTTEGEARIEAVLYSGPRVQVDFHTADLDAGFAVELVPAGTTHLGNALCRVNGEDETSWFWGDLAVQIPSRPTPFTRSYLSRSPRPSRARS